jgi:hypothetical protein
LPRRRLDLRLLRAFITEGLEDAAAVLRLDGIGPDEITQLRQIDRDAHPLLRRDLGVVVVHLARVGRLARTAVVALVGR